MKIFKLNQNLQIIKNQFKAKLLLKTTYILNLENIDFKINANILKLRTFHDENVLECFLLFDLLFRSKSTVKSFQRKYQQSSLQIALDLRNYNFYNFLLLLQVFYFPLFIRRNLHLNLALDSTKNVIFNLMELNNFPFFPDVYFKWNSPLNCFLNLSKIYSICGEQNMSLTGLVMAYFKNPVYITATNVKTI